MFNGLTIDSIAARAVLVPMPRPLRTAAGDVVDEWFSTGNIGRVDEDGYFFLIARQNI